MSAWDRVDAELRRRGRGWQWLADKLEYTIQRCQNWKDRDIPKGEYGAVAAAMGESLDWVAGLAPPKYKLEEGEALHLSPGELLLVLQFRELMEAHGFPATTPWCEEALLLAREIQRLKPSVRRPAHAAAVVAIAETRDRLESAEPPADAEGKASARNGRRPTRKQAKNSS